MLLSNPDFASFALGLMTDTAAVTAANNGRDECMCHYFITFDNDLTNRWHCLFVCCSSLFLSDGTELFSLM